MRKIVEIDSRQNLDISRIIRNEAESNLKSSEDEFTRISHQVDILIYEIEPVLELIAVQGFNKLLCGGGLQSLPWFQNLRRFQMREKDHVTRNVEVFFAQHVVDLVAEAQSTMQELHQKVLMM